MVYGKASSVVTDGAIDQNAGFTHSTFEESPWVEIDLGTSQSVAVTRTIMRHYPSRSSITFRSCGFTVTVDSTICGENQIVLSANTLGALTTDTVCGSTLSGSTVRVSLPTGGRRYLQVTEVEVYGPGILASSTCYSNTSPDVYPYMNQCKTCSGPGPSQVSCPFHCRAATELMAELPLL